MASSILWTEQIDLNGGRVAIGQVGTRWLSFWSQQVASGKQEEEMIKWGQAGCRSMGTWAGNLLRLYVLNRVLPVQTREKRFSLGKPQSCSHPKKKSVLFEGFCGDHPPIHPFECFLRHKIHAWTDLVPYKFLPSHILCVWYTCTGSWSGRFWRWERETPVVEGVLPSLKIYMSLSWIRGVRRIG